MSAEEPVDQGVIPVDDLLIELGALYMDRQALRRHWAAASEREAQHLEQAKQWASEKQHLIERVTELGAELEDLRTDKDQSEAAPKSPRRRKPPKATAAE